MPVYTSSTRGSPPKGAKYPFAVLRSDRWDDFGYKTLYHVQWYSSSSDCKELGSVKILQRGEYSTNLPSRFDVLGPDYCSLGQELSYYKEVAALGKKHQDRLLRALRDVVYDPQIGEAFQTELGFNTSLMRFSEATKAYRQGSSTIKQQQSSKPALSFTFKTRLSSATAPFRVTLDFGNDDRAASRMVAFIGKNGTGKTWLLSRLSATLSGDELNNATFTPQRPSFSRVIALSYSAFDRFKKPNSGQTFSYYYCGLYDDSGHLQSRPSLFKKIQVAFKAIRSSKRVAAWDNALGELFAPNLLGQLKDYLEARADGDKETRPPSLSSGQLILFTTLTQLIALLAEQSIVLFDEPELHLHPNAIAGLMRCLDAILRQFDSYCVMATHSPLIVQQIPSAYVRVFTRVDRQTFIRPLSIESFGENLSTLTDEVFQVNTDPSLFREKLEELAQNQSEEEIVSAFPHGLNFNARAILRTLTVRLGETEGES